MRPDCRSRALLWRRGHVRLLRRVQHVRLVPLRRSASAFDNAAISVQRTVNHLCDSRTAPLASSASCQVLRTNIEAIDYRRLIVRGRTVARLLIAVIACGIAATSAAHEPQFSVGRLCQILDHCQSPSRYASRPFLAPPAVYELTLGEVQRVCRAPRRLFGGAPASNIMGCSHFVGTRCVVYVPKDVRAVLPELYDLILAHELAHCRGWTH